MKDLISGKEALIALANGKEVLIRNHHWDNFDDLTQDFSLSVFFLGGYEFKLKPRTIKIGDVDVPAPFEPKEGDAVFALDNAHPDGFSSFVFDSDFFTINFGAWRTEE